jgi:hypothetical protein
MSARVRIFFMTGSFSTGFGPEVSAGAAISTSYSNAPDRAVDPYPHLLHPVLVASALDRNSRYARRRAIGRLTAPDLIEGDRTDHGTTTLGGAVHAIDETRPDLHIEERRVSPLGARRGHSC